MRRLLAVACIGAGMNASSVHACEQFRGSWSGRWTQGFYGTQWIHVTDVSPDCVARIAYNPTGSAIPDGALAVVVRDGVIEFICHRGIGGVCRLEVVDGVMKTRYSDPSGFVNTGTFKRQP